MTYRSSETRKVLVRQAAVYRAEANRAATVLGKARAWQHLYSVRLRLKDLRRGLALSGAVR